MHKYGTRYSYSRITRSSTLLTVKPLMLNSQVKDKKLLSPRITIVKAKDGESSISMKSRCKEREN